MYLSVQLAARRLGVSPHTIRRWTASGFLPCTRTAGGHRRIQREDVDELAGLIHDGDHLSARIARERELETLVDTSIALTSRLDLPELLVEIARRMTALLDCHFCAISDYDERSDTVRVLADFDRHGRRVADWEPYALKEFPYSKRLMLEQELGVVNVSDPRADPAETAIMRHWGEKSQLIVPLVYREHTVGLLEVYDGLRERRFTRQELRLARALAGLAAVALQNAKAFGRLAHGEGEGRDLQTALERTVAGLPALAAAATVDDAVRAAATLAFTALPAVAAVVRRGDLSAEAGTGPAAGDAVAAHTPGAAADARVTVAAAATRAGDLVLTVTLDRTPTDGHAALARLIALSAARAVDAAAEPA
jgi:excisionase family DNA binding protein